MAEVNPKIAKTMHGARAILNIEGKPVGIFNNVSYGVSYDSNPVYILGRFNPAEIVLTGQEPINVTATGWRILDHGPYADAKVPPLKDLLNHQSITLTIVDRQTNTTVMEVVDVRPTGYSTSISSRGLQELTCNFVGTAIRDEQFPNDDDTGAQDLP